jgi:hypothetical protein
MFFFHIEKLPKLAFVSRKMIMKQQMPMRGTTEGPQRHRLSSASVKARSPVGCKAHGLDF